MKIKRIQLINYMFLFSLFFTACQQDDFLNETSSTNMVEHNFKTVSTKQVQEAYQGNFMARGAENWITPYFDYTDSIPILETNEYIRVTPVVEQTRVYYSRMFSLEIEGNLESVLYHMKPNESSTRYSFNGWTYATDLNGIVHSIFEVENNLIVKYFTIVDPNLDVHIDELLTSNDGNPEGVVEVDGGDLDDVIVCDCPSSGSGGHPIPIFMFFPVFEDVEPGGAIEPSNPNDNGTPGSGGATNQDEVNEDNCPPGQIKDDNGDCIDPDDACPDGYVLNDSFDCVEKPCLNNPVNNPEIAGQLVSGINGGRFGCTRIGGICDGESNKKMHGGVDIKNEYGEPVFAMYDGYATSVEKYFEGAGWISYQTATVGGEQISIQYFHLQENGRASGSISAGDIIGYQGDSGNLKNAIKRGTTESHTHIKIKNSNGTITNPEDWIGSLTITENEKINNNDCE